MIAAIGPRGEGKSHWLHQQIRDELKAGRKRVYTNSATIKFDAMSRQTGIALEDLKERLVILGQDRWRDPSIWPVWEPDHSVVQPGLFEPGSMIVIDEAHFFLGSELPSIPKEFTRFHDMSRHMTDDNGTPIDMFVSSQYRTSFHKEVKKRIEYVYEFKNHDVNGLTKGLGSIAKYRSANNYKSNFLNEEMYTRDKTVYELYDSTGTGGGSNIAEAVSNKKFIRKKLFVAIGAVLFGVVALSVAAVLLTKMANSKRTVAGFGNNTKPAATTGAVAGNTAPFNQPGRCSGAFFLTAQGYQLLTQDGNMANVSSIVKQNGLNCELDFGGCHWSVRGTCAGAGLGPGLGG